MNSIIYLVGLAVIAMAILSFVGLRWRHAKAANGSHLLALRALRSDF